MAISPDGKNAYVSRWFSNSVAIIDTANNTVISSVGVGTNPSLVAFVSCVPATITAVNANPSVLWPPNHKMIPVTLSVSTSGGCGTVSCKIISVSSNEPVAPDGDWVITGNLTLSLRAARSENCVQEGAHESQCPGTGRVYTITVQCTDAAANKTTKTVTVNVPHDQGH